MEKAISQAPKDVDIKIKWRPFFLSPPDTWDQFGPDAKTKGVNKEDFYRHKFGVARMNQIMPRLNEAFAKSGCGSEMNMTGKTGPTLDSHRLIAFAGQKSEAAQDALVEELFKNYFIEGKTICDPEVVAAAGEKVGLENARAFLADPKAGLDQVNEELQMAKGISGVPFFIIKMEDGRRPLTLSGGQPPEAFLEAFEELCG